jgi:hypothetical protein
LFVLRDAHGGDFSLETGPFLESPFYFLVTKKDSKTAHFLALFFPRVWPTLPNEDLARNPANAYLCATICLNWRLSENLHSGKSAPFIGGAGFSVKHYIGSQKFQ